MIHENSYKYLKQPSPELVYKIVELAGVSALQFERFHGMKKGLICHYKQGYRSMPTRFWHIFYEAAKKHNIHEWEWEPSPLKKPEVLPIQPKSKKIKVPKPEPPPKQQQKENNIKTIKDHRLGGLL